jgi:murein DD-endopeptidase MepM/ murein hydrolase activator NlpD
MKARSAFAFATATCLVVGVLAPNAAAQSAEDKRVQAARELKALQASDVQLAQAIKTLDAQVKQTDVQAQSARQSVKSARIAQGLAESRLRTAEAALARVRSQLVARALAEYKQQSGGYGSALGASGDISEAVRRQALLDHVTKVDNDVLDQLHATRQDIERQRARAQRAKEIASARARVAEDRLRQLVRDRASRGRLNAALEKRIAEVQAEVIALEGDDAAVRRIVGSSGATGGTVVGKTSKYGLQWPLRGRLTSGFGRRWGRLHAGIDIADPKGTPIHAAKAGTVVFAGQMRGYGNVVIIDHGGGLSTLYGHQSRLGCRRGQRVSQGQTIGYVGSTGHSTGNHLHFETRINGRPQNPRNFLP